MPVGSFLVSFSSSASVYYPYYITILYFILLFVTAMSSARCFLIPILTRYFPRFNIGNSSFIFSLYKYRNFLVEPFSNLVKLSKKMLVYLLWIHSGSTYSIVMNRRSAISETSYSSSTFTWILNLQLSSSIKQRCLENNCLELSYPIHVFLTMNFICSLSWWFKSSRK